jgi:hypothetical protein
MGTNETILLKAQAGVESTRGTNVAATRKVYAQITPSYTKALMDFSDTTATFFDRRRPAYGREKIAFSAKDICTFEDLAWWAQFFVKGGVTGVADAGTPIAYTYTYAPSTATDDLKSMTLEFNESGNPYETAQVMVKTATLRMDADNDSEPGWMIDLELMGRDWATTTFTAALTDRATEVILARGTKLYIDAAGGTIGTTQKTGSLINASITFDTGIHYKAFAEDITGYAPNKVGRGAYRVDAQFTFEFDSDTEFANYRSTDAVPRLIQLQRDGTQIHGSSATNKSLKVNLYNLIWNSWARSDREGNLTATFGGAGFYDATNAKLVELIIVNALSTLV